MRLAPGAVIGIVGGGQLGRMIALAAARLGYRAHVLTPEGDAPAVQVTNLATIADYRDPAALARFGAAVDVVTIEFENLPVATLEVLARVCPAHPAPEVLAICQDRRLEKAFLAAIDAPIARVEPVASAAELARLLAAWDGPAVLKTARLGYDGKGQLRLGPGSDAEAAWTELGTTEAVLEDWIDLTAEVSVITARDQAGRQVSYPPALNQHQDGILARTTAPAPLPAPVAAEAVELAERIAAALGVVGLLAVEMFVTHDHRLLVNELAPRPHNSGHWTIDACAVSQFEQLVRAICGLPLGPTAPFAAAVMDNLIGAEIEGWPELLAEPGARLHLYGKAEVRPGRKLGHVTRLRPLG